MPSIWTNPTPVVLPDEYTNTEDLIRCNDLQFLHDHRHDVLYFDKTQQTLANSTTKTTVATYVVPASMLGTTGVLTFAACARVRCTAGFTNNLAATFEYGGQSISGAMGGVHAYNDWAIAFFRGLLIADGAAALQVGSAEWYGPHQSGGIIGPFNFSAAALTVNSAVDQNLIFTLASDRLNADSSWTYYYFSVFGAP